MKNNPQLAMAIDIGTTKIAIMIGQLNGNNMSLIIQKAVRSQGIHRGMVENAEDTVQSIKACLELVRAEAQVKKIDINALRNVTVGIAGEHICGMHCSTNDIRPKSQVPISAKEIADIEAKMYHPAIKAGQKVLYAIPKNYNLDGKTVPYDKVVGCYCSSITANYYVIVADQAATNAIETCVERCGLTVKKLVLEPLASAAALLSADEKEEGVALVDIGGGTSDMVVYSRNEIKSVFVIPSGGEFITEDIRETCNISQQRAELLKTKHGSCFCSPALEERTLTFATPPGIDPPVISRKTLSSIIQYCMDEILATVMFKIEACNIKVNSIVFTGGGSLINDLPQLVKYRTGINARIGYPVVQMHGDASIKTLSPALATNVGLLLADGYCNVEKKGGLGFGSFFINGAGARILEKAKGRLVSLFDEPDDTVID